MRSTVVQTPSGTETETDDTCTATGHILMARCTKWRLVLCLVALSPGMAIVSWVMRLNSFGLGSKYRLAYVISGYCAILAVVISFWLVWQHLLNYTSPQLQLKIIRIVLMVPIYSIHSWCALRFHSWAVYLNLFRDSYESFVVYQFFSLLVAYLGGDEQCVLLLLKQPPMRALFPLSLVARRPFRPGPVFLRRVYICVLQYVLLKPTLALLAMILTGLRVYKEGAIADVTNAYFCLTLITTLSVGVAVFALAHFYVATSRLLEGVNPLGMFISVKAILFASFWQSVVLAVCTNLHIIPGAGVHPAAEVAVEVQDFLICVEMLFVALAFRSVFSYRPFIHGPGDWDTWRTKLRLPSWKQATYSLDPRGMVGDAYNDVTRLLGGHLNEDFLDRFLVDVEDGCSQYTELSSLPPPSSCLSLPTVLSWPSNMAEPDNLVDHGHGGRERPGHRIPSP